MDEDDKSGRIVGDGERKQRVDHERHVLLHQRGRVLEAEGQNQKRRQLMGEALPETQRGERLDDEEVEERVERGKPVRGETREKPGEREKNRKIQRTDEIPEENP